MNRSLLLLALSALAGAACADDHFSGTLGASSQRVERGVSESSGASAAADLEWSPLWDLYLGLGAATVDPDQFGGAHLQWSPRLGWRPRFGSEHPLQATIGLSGHYTPGARGQAYQKLPPRLASRADTQAQQTDFGTAELNLALAWRGATLSFDRSLSDYDGIGASSTTNALEQRVENKVAGSLGSWHLGLGLRHEFDGGFAAWGQAGRQVVKNFEELNYTDWSLGGSWTWAAHGLTLALEAGGTNARSDYWRVQRADGSTREVAGRHATLSASWAFGF